MAVRRSFKTDESFLEKLAIGAIGARSVFADLQRQGHKPIELERGSMDYKIWKNIKIKRLRVPDLLCLNCGTRVEARAKTQLVISMSHSLSDPERGWDKGLNDHDVVAISICTKTGEGPTDWQANPLIQFVSAASLRKAFAENQVVTEKPKGAGEGFELRVTWPSAVASSDGVVSALTTERLQFKREADQRTISLSLSKKTIPLQPLVQVGDRIRAGAAWAIGELQQPSSVDALVQVFLELAEPIRIEAARALRKITSATGSNVAAKLPAAQDDQRAGIAWAVSRSGRVKVDELLPLLVDADARRWVAYILGTQEPQACIDQIEQLRQRDPEVYFAVTVLWKILASWVYHLEEY